MSNGNGGYRRLSRSDLRGFNEDAIRIITAAMNAGGTGRVSNRNHCIIRGPEGRTLSVAMGITKANRGIQNATAEFRRVFGMEWTEVEKPKEKQTAEDLAPAPSLGDPHPTLTCPVKTCDAVFVTEGARYSHIHDKHIVCREPGCHFVTDHAPAESGHYRIVHLGEAPRKGITKPKPKPKKAAAPQPAAQETVRVVTKVVKEGEVLKQIRHLLGDDPRLAELREENQRLQEALGKAEARVAELDAKLKLLKEALEL